MGRLVVGLIVGAAGAAAIFSLNQSNLTLMAPLVAMLGGLLAGALLGWRNPRPGGALRAGLLAGAIAGFLMGIAQFSSVARVVHTPGAPIWMRGISQYSPMYGWLTRGMGGLLVLLTALIGGCFAGVLSGWTGFRTPAWLPAPEDTMSILPDPFEAEPEPGQ